MTVANEAGKIALDIMTLYSLIKLTLQRLNANDPLAKDINGQLDLLIYAGFIRHIPYTQLKAIPRYVIRYWKDVEKQAKKDTVIPEHDTFRWALEELRVSLFAQHTKPPFPFQPNVWINSGMSVE